MKLTWHYGTGHLLYTKVCRVLILSSVFYFVSVDTFVLCNRMHIDARPSWTASYRTLRTTGLLSSYSKIHSPLEPIEGLCLCDVLVDWCITDTNLCYYFSSVITCRQRIV